MPLMMAQSEVAALFSFYDDVNYKGSNVIRCSRCEGISEITRNKSFQLMLGSITQTNEDIAIYCHEIRPEISNGDANLCYTLLIDMSAKHEASMSKHAQLSRKLLFCKQLKLCMFILPLFVLYRIVYLYNACISPFALNFILIIINILHIAFVSRYRCNNK
jgi:hypothetical protein